MAKINFTKIDSIINGVLDLLTIPKPPDPKIPAPLILLSKNRVGLSAQEMAAEVIRRRTEAGLPVGNFPDGQPNPAELLEFIRFEVLLEAITTKMRTAVAIEPGTTITAQGLTATGVPVTVTGVVSGIGKGSAVVQ